MPKIGLLDPMPALGGGNDEASLGQSRAEQLQRHWRAALQQAAAVARRMNRGFGKDGLDGVREFEGAINPS